MLFPRTRLRHNYADLLNDIIDLIGMEGLGLIINLNKVGNPTYNLKSMLKLLVYGYSYS